MLLLKHTGFENSADVKSRIIYAVAGVDIHAIEWAAVGLLGNLPAAGIKVAGIFKSQFNTPLFPDGCTHLLLGKASWQIGNTSALPDQVNIFGDICTSGRRLI